MQSLKEVKPEPDPIVVAGLMAGTSLDGIDVVLACTDGHRLTRLCPAMTCPYSPQTRLLIGQAVELAGAVIDRPELLEVLDLRIAEEHAQAVLSLLGTQQQVMQPSLIGFHGQTVWHAPQAGSSVQLGDAQHLANRLGVDVIAELRQADLGAGGQGAPLAPVYHAALLDQAGITGSAAWLNLGGVANLTLLDGSISAGFDCGPANALMDRIARERLGQAYDCGGEKALTGVPDTRLVDAMLSDRYFDSAPPKSLDREHFAHSDAMTALQQMPVHDALLTVLRQNWSHFWLRVVCVVFQPAFLSPQVPPSPLWVDVGLCRAHSYEVTLRKSVARVCGRMVRALARLARAACLDEGRSLNGYEHLVVCTQGRYRAPL